jgi:hypothetical protein
MFVAQRDSFQAWWSLVESIRFPRMVVVPGIRRHVDS